MFSFLVNANIKVFVLPVGMNYENFTLFLKQLSPILYIVKTTSKQSKVFILKLFFINFDF